MKKKFDLKIWICYVLLVSIIVGAVGGIVYYNRVPFENGSVTISKPLPAFTLKIVDPSSKTRPVAVMINNIWAARQYHTGLQDAYLVYEILAEGSITRLLAVYKDKETARIGSVRSSRHYYLDYALENDAIYVHFGWSPQAQADVSKLKINNINGLYDQAFWRDTSLDVDYEHTAYTNMENIHKVVEEKGYRDTTDQKLLLNYSIKPYYLDEFEDSKVANNISIDYASDNNTSFVYNQQERVYYRFKNGEAHQDYETKKQYTAKNIIVIQVGMYDLNDGSGKGRRGLDNLGTGDGYYITNGYAVPITWSKESRTSQTVYKYLSGEEITVNDGNTYIQIQPKGQNLSITE